MIFIKKALTEKGWIADYIFPVSNKQIRQASNRRLKGPG